MLIESLLVGFLVLGAVSVVVHTFSDSEYLPVPEKYLNLATITVTLALYAAVYIGFILDRGDRFAILTGVGWLYILMFVPVFSNVWELSSKVILSVLLPCISYRYMIVSLPVANYPYHIMYAIVLPISILLGILSYKSVTRLES